MNSQSNLIRIAAALGLTRIRLSQRLTYYKVQTPSKLTMAELISHVEKTLRLTVSEAQKIALMRGEEPLPVADAATSPEVMPRESRDKSISVVKQSIGFQADVHGAIVELTRAEKLIIASIQMGAKNRITELDMCVISALNYLTGRRG